MGLIWSWNSCVTEAKTKKKGEKTSRGFCYILGLYQLVAILLKQTCSSDMENYITLR